MGKCFFCEALDKKFSKDKKQEMDKGEQYLKYGIIGVFLTLGLYYTYVLIRWALVLS